LGKALLTFADFEYLGLFLVPEDTSAIRMGWSAGALTGRRVGGDIRLFIAGKRTLGDSVYEIAYPGRQAGQVASAPRAPLVRAWGDVYQGKRLIYRDQMRETKGLLWFDDRLWWAYGDEYNASSSSWDPSIGCTVLNDSQGTYQAFGPWRTRIHSQQSRGFMTVIPAWFAEAYTSGRRIGVGAAIASGNVQSPWGASLAAFSPPPTSAAPDPVQPAPAYTADLQASLATTRLVLHDISHPLSRDANYRLCGWNVLYDCAQGSWIKAGEPRFQPVDTMGACAWIDLPDKHGVVYFGQLATKVEGVTYANDTLPHVWYGMETCCHGQVGRPFWAATGPGTPTSVPHAWIFDPEALAKVAQGQREPYEPTYASVVAARALGVSETSVGFWYFGGAHFDGDSRLLFVTTVGTDNLTSLYEVRPVIHVWRIR
jgi:hypothetical protein